MSNEINAAGKDLVVESLTELGAAASSKRVSEIKRVVDAQLIKRDYDKLKDQMGDITGDGVLISSEKQELYREWKSIVSSNSVYTSQSESCGITGQIVFTRYQEVFTALNTQLSVLLEDLATSSDISGIDLLGLFVAYYEATSLLEEEIHQYQTGLLNGLDDRTKCELHLTCSSGLALPSDGSSAMLSAVLLKEGEDCTHEMDDSDFTWERQEAGWASRNGKSIQITDSDLVDGSANFICTFKHFYSTSMYWRAFNFISVQRIVKGTDALSLNILDTNGLLFRPGKCDTDLVAQVLWGIEDVTDSLDPLAFEWFRRSSDPDSDARWLATGKGRHKKMLELTSSDYVDKADFYYTFNTAYLPKEN